MKTQRDYFLEKLFEKAKVDSDIILIVADLGASVLSEWQKCLPNQFVYAGISEQNAINIASGLASQDKKVFIYFMASWTCRCLEQIRYSLALPNYPVTILANGVGLGYAPAGPAHETNEDISYVRSILNIDIISVPNNNFIDLLVDEVLINKKLRYIRLERNYDSILDKYSYKNLNCYEVLESNITTKKENKILLASYGYMLGRTLSAYETLKNTKEISVIDLYKIKPLFDTNLCNFIKLHNSVLTIEEQTFSGGFGSALSEFMITNQIYLPIHSMNLPEKYLLENGNRDYLLNKCELSSESIVSKVNSL